MVYKSDTELTDSIIPLRSANMANQNLQGVICNFGDPINKTILSDKIFFTEDVLQAVTV